MPCNSSHYDADHGDLDKDEVGSAAVFDVYGETSATVEPTEGAFDDQRFGTGRSPCPADPQSVLETFPERFA